MIHKVKSGDTLLKIARRNGTTVAKLLKANPRFKSNPNLIRVGDVINIPSDKPARVARPSTRPQGQCTDAWVLGKLSEQYETGGRGPGTVSTGKGDRGGVSYGSYQMTSKPAGGTVKRFVSQSTFPFRKRFAGLTPGTGQFTKVWREIASSHPEKFQRSQHEFIKQTHFDPLVEKILREDGLDVLTRSHALQDVIWSTAVQHGPGSNIPHRALSTLNLRSEESQFDEKLIAAIYAERGRKMGEGALAHFSRNSPDVQKGVALRFKRELRDALNLLAQGA